jgi:hypothetical protein
MAAATGMPLLVIHRKTVDEDVWLEVRRDGQNFLLHSNDTSYVTRDIFKGCLTVLFPKYVAVELVHACLRAFLDVLETDFIRWMMVMQQWRPEEKEAFFAEFLTEPHPWIAQKIKEICCAEYDRHAIIFMCGDLVWRLDDTKITNLVASAIKRVRGLRPTNFLATITVVCEVRPALAAGIRENIELQCEWKYSIDRMFIKRVKAALSLEK